MSGQVEASQGGYPGPILPARMIFSMRLQRTWWALILCRVKESLLKTTDAFGCRLTGPGGASFQRDSQGDQETVINI